ncbi:ARM repeat-containing protein [Schizopora paradoxa]|uniref:ARM repeat-containing protein n=1 Tax=Schizopora paradoxa TaxID=27342 RepID=A0A0H2SSK1_9AGAM|nr:ARM repeat-containing protein [Schizopora paradoxa]
MQSSSPYRQQFIPLLPDSYSRTRQHSAPSPTSTAASIWAPQPQSPGGTWPKSLHSYANHHLGIGERRGLGFRQPLFPLSNERPLTREDVFGPLSGTEQASRKPIGAIGEGRQKGNPLSDSGHFEQMFRSLDLTSPPPIDVPSYSTSQVDYDSPSTSSSYPATPLESSPMGSRSADVQFNAFCDFPSHAPPSLHSTSTPLSASLPPSNGSTESSWSDNFYSSIQADALQGQTQTFSQATFNSCSSFDSPVDGLTGSPFSASPVEQVHISNTFQKPAGNSLGWPKLQIPYEPPQAYNRPCEPDVARSPFDERSLGHTFNNAPVAPQHRQPSAVNEPINFLSLLHPSSSPPYPLFVSRIVKSSDQQASIFLQQKLKVADEKERAKIIDAICTRGTEMMSHRFGNWAVQRCLEAASSSEERRKIAACMKGNVVELATNCYGCHVLQKALDCEEDIRLLIVSELLLGDPAKTLINKHASHVWSKIMELTWTPPAPPIFAYVNQALQGKWASLACHETGSLVVQHAFENLEDSAKDGIIDELLKRGPDVFAEVAKNQWGSYCIQHILEHGSEKHRELALDHLLAGLLEFSTNEQGFKSITKALKEGNKATYDKFVNRMRECPLGGRRAIIVDLALSTTGSQLIATVLPNIDKEQRTALYDAIRGHIVTLRGCKTGSKIIWLFDRMVGHFG